MVPPELTGADGMLIWNVLDNVPVLSILTMPVAGSLPFTASAPLTVIKTEHQPGPAPTGATPMTDAQLEPM